MNETNGHGSLAYGDDMYGQYWGTVVYLIVLTGVLIYDTRDLAWVLASVTVVWYYGD